MLRQWPSTKWPSSTRTDSPFAAYPPSRLTLSSSRFRNDAGLQLWQAAVAGDEEARAALIARAVELAPGELRKFDRDVREDIEQMIAQSVLQALASGVNPRVHVEGLLHWRARTEVTRHIRTQVKARRIKTVPVMLEFLGHNDSPLRASENDEMQSAVADCLEQVPNQDHRQVFQMRVFEGMEPSEIATKRDIPAGRCRVWLARALTVVRDCLLRKFRDGGAS